MDNALSIGSAAAGGHLLASSPRRVLSEHEHGQGDCTCGLGAVYKASRPALSVAFLATWVHVYRSPATRSTQVTQSNNHARHAPRRRFIPTRRHRDRLRTPLKSRSLNPLRRPDLPRVKSTRAVSSRPLGYGVARHHHTMSCDGSGLLTHGLQPHGPPPCVSA